MNFDLAVAVGIGALLVATIYVNYRRGFEWDSGSFLGAVAAAGVAILLTSDYSSSAKYARLGLLTIVVLGYYIFEDRVPGREA